ncbi:MAG: caspase family protein, partial [Bacteroidota bacterium]
YLAGKAISPDTKKVLLATNETKSKTIKLIDVETGKVIQTFNGLKREASSLCFSPDGQRFASGSYDGLVTLWDIATGSIIQTFSGHTHPPKSLAFSPDGKKIVSRAYDGIKVWNADNGAMLKSKYMQEGEVNFSPDGKTIVFANSTSPDLIFWDFETDKVVKTLQGHTKGISSFHVNPEGTKLLSGSGDKSVRLWDVESGKVLQTFGGLENPKIFTLTMSPDGKKIAFGGSDSTIKLWNLASGQAVKLLKGHKDWIRKVKFSSDGKKLFSASSDNTVKTWDSETGFELKSFTTKGSFNGLDLSKDNKIIAINPSNTISILNAETGAELKSFTTGQNILNEFALSPDGKNLVYAGYNDKIVIFDTESGTVINELSGDKSSADIIYSPDGRKILAGHKSVYQWDAKTGKLIDKISVGNQEVMCINYSSDMKKIVGGFWKNHIKIWDAETGKELKTMTGHTSYISSVLFSPDNKWIISGSDDHMIKIWNAETGQLALTFVSYDNGSWVVVSPNGRFDGTQDAIKLLHFVKGMEIIPLESFYEQYYTPGLTAMTLFGEKELSVNINITDLKPKPEVKITSPQNNTMASSSQLTVSVEVTDMGGGIDEILLYHNGKLLETTNRGFKPVIQNKDKETKTFTVNMVNGENRLKATAFNNQRTEAIPDEITVVYKSAEVSKPNLYLFVIGINEYKNSKYNLNYAVADAESFKIYLEEGSKTIFNSVQISFLKNSDVTKSAINQAFETIKSSVKQEDVFIFYYAGHGVMSEEESAQFYLIPTDVTQLYGQNKMLQEKAISQTELRQFSTDIKAQKQLFILDACQSGGMVEMLASRGAAEEKAISQLARSTGTYWLTASGSEQFAGEFAQLGHGIFTYCILQALTGKADGQNDKKITIQELSTFVNDEVPKLSKQYKGNEQYPNTYGFGHDFPIIIVK